MTARRAIIPGSRRRGRAIRLAGVALATLILLGVAVIGGEGPAGAQDAERAGARIRLSGMVNRITQTIRHQFTVEVDRLAATADYQVLVSSDKAATLGIGGCGTATQTQTVTGVTARTFKFVIHACAVGEATVTAEVRRTGASRPEASARQAVTVEAMPEEVFEFPSGASQTAQQAANRPGFVRGVSFPEADRKTTSVKVTWHGDDADETPNTANGGEPLTGFGLLFWRKGAQQPGYEKALVKGSSARSHTYPNLQPGTTYLFRIHACNGTGSCGYWTHPPLEVKTKSATKPKSPHTISVDQQKTTSARLRWSPDADTGGVKLTGFGIRWRVKGTNWPTRAQAVVGRTARSYVMSGLNVGTTYEASLQACNGRDRCSPWTAGVEFGTGNATKPKSPHTISVDQRMETSARLNWRPDADTGGVALTGFGIRWREKKEGEPWPTDAQAPNVPPGDQTYTMTPLKANTTYEVSLQACNGTDRCSPWTAALEFSTTGPERVVETSPGPVRGLTIIRLGDGELDVEWQAPLNTGRKPLTGYKLQYKLNSSSSWPSASTDVPLGARLQDPVRYTIQRLTNRTKYDLQVQACNADECGDWAGPVSGTPGTATAPKKVDVPSVAGGRNRLTVTWNAPSDGGSPITHYHVQVTVKPAPGSDPTWPAANVANKVLGTSTSLGTLHNSPDPLVNGTAYVVRVRACNAKGCGDYSDHQAGTPRELAPTRLAPPRNLDVEPLPARRARLTWDAVANAAGYIVQFRQHGTAWPVEGTLNSRVVTTPSVEIDLDGVLLRMDRSDLDPAKHGPVPYKGLGDEPAYDIQVKATDNTGNYTNSHYSGRIIVIDTPIIRANGDNRDASRRAREGKAVVTWKPIEQVVPDMSSGGTYRPRYRKSAEDHTSLDWTLDDFEAYKTDNVTVRATTATIGKLPLEQVYAIQLNYDSDGSGSGPIDVFSARDAYVWPSRTPPTDGDRIANMPAVSRLKDRTYTYRICTDTFASVGETRKGEWVQLIDHAFDRWEEKLDGLVTITRLDENANPCVSYDEIAKQWAELVRAKWRTHAHYKDHEIRPLVKDYIDRIVAFMLPVNPVENPDLWSELFEFRSRIGQTIEADRAINEIKLFDETQGDVKYFIFRQVFSNLAESLRQGCWLNEDIAIEDSNVLMCAESNWWIEPPLERIWSSDILIRRSKFMNEDLDVATKESRMNTCGGNAGDDDYSAYSSFIHEIGHVLGVGYGREGDRFERGHPARDVVDSVMTYETVPKCAPYPLDLMLINALYQTEN